MKYVIKFGGIIAVAFSLSFFGIYKAYRKRAYIARLKDILAALYRADDMLCAGAGSREKILKNAFGGIEGIRIINGNALISEGTVKGEACGCLIEFFREFGNSELAVERRRISRVCKKLSLCIETEQREYAATAKIWQTAGICAGIGAGIMLI